MRILFFLLPALLAGMFAGEAAAQNARAVKVLQEVKRVVENKPVSATFTKSLAASPDAKPLTYSGDVKLYKNKFRIEIGDQMVFCDGKTMWTYMADYEEVTVSNYDPKENFSPDRMFKLSQDDHKVLYGGKTTAYGKPAEKVDLLPTNKSADYAKIEAWVGTASHLPLRVKIYQRNGAIVTYAIKNVATNKPLPDSVFRFDPNKYAVEETIDNR